MSESKQSRDWLLLRVLKVMGINAGMVAILAMCMNAVGIKSVPFRSGTPIRGSSLSLLFVQDTNADSSSINGQVCMMPMNPKAVSRSTMVYINRGSKLLLNSICFDSQGNCKEGFNKFCRGFKW